MVPLSELFKSGKVDYVDFVMEGGMPVIRLKGEPGPEEIEIALLIFGLTTSHEAADKDDQGVGGEGI